MAKLDPNMLYIVGTPGAPINEADMIYIGARPVRRLILGRQYIWVAPLVIPS